ncbi:MAG: site-specific integrase, partial [Bacteroidota bacterium]
MSDAFFISQFETYLVSERKVSPHTSKAYLTDLSQCFSYLATLDIQNIQSVKHLHIKSWLADQMVNKADPKSVNRKISSLKTYFKYLLRHQLVDKNPMLKITSPKIAKKLPVFVAESAMDDILDGPESDAIDPLAKDIVSTIYQTGIRLNELITLKKGDVDIRNKTIKVLGKRNKERIIPVTEELAGILEPYLALHSESSFVFNTPKGRQL